MQNPKTKKIKKKKFKNQYLKKKLYSHQRKILKNDLENNVRKKIPSKLHNQNENIIVENQIYCEQNHLIKDEKEKGLGINNLNKEDSIENFNLFLPESHVLSNFQKKFDVPFDLKNVNFFDIPKMKTIKVYFGNVKEKKRNYLSRNSKHLKSRPKFSKIMTDKKLGLFFNKQNKKELTISKKFNRKDNSLGLSLDKKINSCVGRWRGSDTFKTLNTSSFQGKSLNPFSKKPTSTRKKVIQDSTPSVKPKLSKQSRCIKKKKKSGCGCSKSKCLRLHCSCFRNNIQCGEHCGCTNCFNDGQHLDVVNKIRAETKKIYSFAFKNPTVSLVVNGKTEVFSKGCSCTNYRCLKNYCGCHKNGFKCNPLCKCTDCGNDKIKMTLEMAGLLYEKSQIHRRKKNKSINLSEFVG